MSVPAARWHVAPGSASKASVSVSGDAGVGFALGGQTQDVTFAVCERVHGVPCCDGQFRGDDADLLGSSGEAVRSRCRGSPWCERASAVSSRGREDDGRVRWGRVGVGGAGVGGAAVEQLAGCGQIEGSWHGRGVERDDGLTASVDDDVSGLTFEPVHRLGPAQIAEPPVELQELAGAVQG